ncbi:vomeronasal type-2 receptor 26-like [Pleurodeles waltl]|uniref:vomeronasal type-2 receptor 26-like n=1 Tax=Pleurodeles waltl TaxID=8319 RepID=UPI0037097BC7
MVFATKEINNNPAILPQVNIGFKIYDSCFSEPGAIEGIFGLLSGQQMAVPNYRCATKPKISVIIGDAPSAACISTARILGITRHPQISFGAGLAVLSDKVQFPSFLRTAANGNYVIPAFIELLLYFGWTWIGILASDSEFAIENGQNLMSHAPKSGICIEFFQLLATVATSKSVSRAVNVVRQSTARVIVCFTFAPQMIPFLKEISAQNIVGKVWIGSTNWLPSPVFSTKDLWPTLHGTVGFGLYNGEIPMFKEFLYSIHPSKFANDVYMKQFWEQVFNCQWRDDLNITVTGNKTDGKRLCTQREKLETLDVSVYDVNNFRFPYKAYNAVYALAQALHDLKSCVPMNGPFSNKTCADYPDFQPWQLLHYLKNVRARNAVVKNIFFDQFGDAPGMLDFMHWQMTSKDTSRFLKLGTYEAISSMGNNLIINNSAIEWGEESRKKVTVDSPQVGEGQSMLLYAGDAVLLSQTANGLLRLMDCFATFMEGRDVQVNLKETYTMICGKRAFPTIQQLGDIDPNASSPPAHQTQPPIPQITQKQVGFPDLPDRIGLSTLSAFHTLLSALAKTLPDQLNARPLCKNGIKIRDTIFTLTLTQPSSLKPGFKMKYHDRTNKHGGNIAVIRKELITCTITGDQTMPITEHINFQLYTDNSTTIKGPLVYRLPGPWTVISNAIAEFITPLEIKFEYYIFLEDLHFHLEDPTDLFGKTGQHRPQEASHRPQVPVSVCSKPCRPGYRKAAIDGKPRCCFECILCSEGHISNQTDSTDCMKCPDDHWSSDLRDQCIAKSIDFLSFAEPLGSILVFISIFFFLNTTCVFGVFFWYRDTPVVKANNRGISYLLLISLMLCFLCALNFIGQPMEVTCMLRQIIFGVIFSLCVSCVLAKTLTVVIIFRATKPNSNLKKFLGPKVAYNLVLTCTLVQVIIGVAWLATSPSFPEHNTSPAMREIILGCNEGSIVWFYSMLAFMGLLASVSFLVSFLARNLPDSFNETKFITFSMLVFVSVWLTFIPAYLSTKGKYLVAVEIFAILSSSAGLLFCIFAPKLFIIFWRPERNSREYLTSQTKGTTKVK